MAMLSKGKKIIIITSVIAFLGIAGVVFFVVFLPKMQASDEPDTTVVDPEINTDVSNMTIRDVVPSAVRDSNDKAKEVIGSGGSISAVNKVYSQAISDSSNDTEKGLLYLAQADFLHLKGDVAGAIERAKKAEPLLKGTSSLLGATSMLAGLYEAAGNKAQASAYYARSATLVPADSNAYDDKAYYEQKAKELAR